jgi:hypothetical protein
MSPSSFLGVGQPASLAWLPSIGCIFAPGSPAASSFAVGVNQLASPEQPLPAVRRSDARSAQIGGPEGISNSFQVSANSGEPFAAILARNLLSKDSCRLALGDERVKSGPQVSFVGMAFSLSRARKRLTGT